MFTLLFSTQKHIEICQDPWRTKSPDCFYSSCFLSVLDPSMQRSLKELREAVKTAADESDERVNDGKGFTLAPAARWENAKRSSCGRDGIVSHVFLFSSSSQTVTRVSAVCHWLYMQRLWRPEEIWNQMFPSSEETRPVFIC